MREIKPYIYKVSEVNGLPFYHYLHIRGGSGSNGKQANSRNGGEYDFIAFYASPQEMNECAYCERLWCIEHDIPFGEGGTIEEAIQNLLTQNHQI